MEQPFTKGPHVRPEKLSRARQFRREMTPSEAAVWQELRRDRTGFHFRRQQTIDGFMADFFCVEAKLVVEIDGGIHDQLIEDDDRRTRALEMRGLRVLRFRNEEVEGDLASVIDTIKRSCGALCGRS